MEMNNETAVEYCERVYPEMTAEFKSQLSTMYTTFCQKNRNYGPENISVGTTLQTPNDVKLSLTGLWFRKMDKINRLKQLVIFLQPDEVGEGIADTYQDLSIYSIISQIVLNGKWGK
jgi:hypothetical protein